MEAGAIIAIILSLIITFFLCKLLFRNTVCTMRAYVTRFILIWAFISMVIGAVMGIEGLY